jgi:hypothetical protein
MRSFKNDADECTEDLQDAADADPRTDYEPTDNESQSGPTEGPNTGGG